MIFQTVIHVHFWGRLNIASETQEFGKYLHLVYWSKSQCILIYFVIMWLIRKSYIFIKKLCYNATFNCTKFNYCLSTSYEENITLYFIAIAGFIFLCVYSCKYHPSLNWRVQVQASECFTALYNSFVDLTPSYTTWFHPGWFLCVVDFVSFTEHINWRYDFDWGCFLVVLQLLVRQVLQKLLPSDSSFYATMTLEERCFQDLRSYLQDNPDCAR